MKDEELYLLFKEATISSLSILKSLLQGRQDIMLWPVEEPEFSPNGLINKIRVILKPRVLSLPDVQQKVSRVPQVSKLCEFVASRDLSEQLVTKQAANPAAEQIFYRLFWPFLWHCLSEIGGLDFDQSVFQDTYEDIMAYFGLPTIKLVFTAPLFGFDTESNENSIDLAPNVSINRVSIELKKQLWHDASISSSWSKEDIISLKYQVTFKEDVPKTDLFSYSTYPEDLENLQSLLRLIKKEAISIRCILLSSSPWYLGPYTGVMTGYLPWATANPLVGRWFSTGSFQGQLMAPSFSSEEIENLKSSWNSLVTMRNQPRLILALHRFSFFYDRPTQEDKLLDLWVGLELLFPEVSPRKRGASQLKIHTITDFLDLKEVLDRRRVKKDLEDSYDLRGKIMHGHVSYQYNLGDLTLKTEDIFAKSLLKCLAQHSLPQP